MWLPLVFPSRKGRDKAKGGSIGVRVTQALSNVGGTV